MVSLYVWAAPTAAGADRASTASAMTRSVLRSCIATPWSRCLGPSLPVGRVSRTVEGGSDADASSPYSRAAMVVAAPLRIGVVGVGRIGTLHAETLSGLDGVSLVV